MSLKSHPTALSVVLLILLYAAGQGSASHGAGRQADHGPPAAAQDVEVFIDLGRDDRRFRVGEPVVVNIHMKNKTGKPLSACLAKAFLQLRLTLVKDGQPVPYLNGLDDFIAQQRAEQSCKSLAELLDFAERDLSEEESKDPNITVPDILDMSPHEMRPVSSLTLFEETERHELPDPFSWDGWYAPLQPGHYELTVERSPDCCGGPSVKSNTIAFEVAPVQGRSGVVGMFLRDLRQWQLGKAQRQPQVGELKHLGDAAMPLLAEFLTDDELGDTAESVLVEMDADKAAPLIFASMPQSDRGVQYHAFKFYIGRIRDGLRFEHARAMHDAAVRCLEAGTNADAAEQALLALGLTGSAADFPLLEKYFDNDEPVELWRARVRDAGEASLARLGHPKYVENIARQLGAAVPRRIDQQRDLALVASIRKAGFTGNKRFVPLLCGRLENLYVENDALDAFPPTPAQEAADALAHIVDGASPDKIASVEQWRARCVKLVRN